MGPHVSSRPSSELKEIARKLDVDISGMSADDAKKAICAKQMQLAMDTISRKNIVPGALVALLKSTHNGNPPKIRKVGVVQQILPSEARRLIISNGGCGSFLVKVKWNCALRQFKPVACADPSTLWVIDQKRYDAFLSENCK